MSFLSTACYRLTSTTTWPDLHASSIHIKVRTMNLHLRWHSPLTLRNDFSNNGIYTTDIASLPDAPGVYIFARTFGNACQALYVGKANSLATRIPQQLNNVQLMIGLLNAQTGLRKLIYAQFLPRPGQQQATSLKAIEHALIRHYLEDGHPLLNVQGTSIVKDSLCSERTILKRFIPKTIYFKRR